MKNTTGRGDVTELEIATALMRTGKKVLKPLSAGLRYDLAVDNDDGTVSRIQCKTGVLRDGCVEFRAYNADARRPRGVSYKGQIEAFAVFCPQSRRAYLVPMAALGSCESKVRLRLRTPLNGQVKGIRYAKGFEIEGATEGEMSVASSQSQIQPEAETARRSR